MAGENNIKLIQLTDKNNLPVTPITSWESVVDRTGQTLQQWWEGILETINNKIDKTSIANALNIDDITQVLSAARGKELYDMMQKGSLFMGVADKTTTAPEVSSPMYFVCTQTGEYPNFKVNKANEGLSIIMSKKDSSGVISWELVDLMPIAQELGDSENTVVSQKMVTDSIRDFIYTQTLLNSEIPLDKYPDVGASFAIKDKIWIKQDVNKISCRFIPLTKGCSYMLESSDSSAYFGILISNNHKEGTPVIFSNGYEDKTSIGANSYIVVKVEQDDTYLYYRTDKIANLNIKRIVNLSLSDKILEIFNKYSFDILLHNGRLPLSNYRLNELSFSGADKVWTDAYSSTRIIPILSGVHYTIKANSSNFAFYSVITKQPALGEAVSFATGYDKWNRVEVNQEKDIIVNSDNEELYLIIREDYPILEIRMDSLNFDKHYVTFDILYQELDKVKQNTYEIIDNIGSLNLDSYPTENVNFANADKVWINSSLERSKFIPVEKGNTYKIIASDTNLSLYTLLKSKGNVGEPVDFANGYNGSIAMQPKTSVEISITEDNLILWIRDGNSAKLPKYVVSEKDTIVYKRYLDSVIGGLKVDVNLSPYARILDLQNKGAIDLDSYEFIALSFAGAKMIWENAYTQTKTIPITQNVNYIIDTTDNQCYYTIVNKKPKLGEQVSVISGYTGWELIPKETSKTIKISTTDENLYLIIRKDWMPTKIAIDGIDFVTSKELSSSITPIVEDILKNNGAIDFNRYESLPINFSSSEGIWKEWGDTKTKFVPLEKGCSYEILTNKDNLLLYTLVTNVGVVGEQVAFAQGYSKWETIQPNVTLNLNIPIDSDAEFIAMRDSNAYTGDLPQSMINKNKVLVFDPQLDAFKKEVDRRIATISSNIPESKESVALFDYRLDSSLSLDQKQKLFNIDKAQLNTDHLILPIGFANHIDYLDPIVFDNEKFLLDISTIDNTESIMVFSNGIPSDSIDADYSMNHGQGFSGIDSHIKVDFSAGRLSVLKQKSSEELRGVDFVVKGNDYVLEWGRKDRYVYGAIYNRMTCERFECVIIDEEIHDYDSSEAWNDKFHPAGWMYYCPAFYVISGSPKFYRFRCYVPDNLLFLFQGDSYTQGHSGYYKNAWSYLAKIFLGKSETCGISGSQLSSCINQYHTSIKGKIKVKNIVVSIGINDSSRVSQEQLEIWKTKYKAYVEELKTDGINPIINCIWPNSGRAKDFNDIIKSFKVDGVKFYEMYADHTGAETIVNGHLTELGNLLSLRIFLNEMQKFIN